MEKINEKYCHNIYCGKDWKLNQKKFIANNNTCVDDCSKFDYEEDNKCYNNLTAEEQNEIIYEDIN